MLFEEILSQRREDVYQHDLFVEHCRAVPATGRKVQNVARLRDPFLAVPLVPNDETHASTFDQCDLLVRMIVRWRDDVWLESQTADHQLFTHYHLTRDSAA